MRKINGEIMKQFRLVVIEKGKKKIGRWFYCNNKKFGSIEFLQFLSTERNLYMERGNIDDWYLEYRG